MVMSKETEEKKFQRYVEILEGYDAENRFRTLPADHTSSIALDFVTNDYMGMAQRHGEFQKQFTIWNPNPIHSASASRLLARAQEESEKLENLLGGLYNREALLFNSGYHANVGAVQALNIPGTVFLCDKLIHASMIDGLAASGANYARWRHNDVRSLETLINRHQDAERLIVMVESIYSMDGDIAPLKELIELKHRYPNLILYVDEAHAFGARGARGLGVCEELDIIPDIDIIVGTFGKAVASAGAFVATSPLLISVLVNRARSFIFSTALPPAVHAWTRMMIIELITMQRERERLLELSEVFRNGIEKITGKSVVSQSHIVPLIIGDAQKTVHIAARLQTSGIDALPIRRPTVPPGGERIRFSISATMTKKNIIFALETIKKALSDD